jgi:tRNA (adenine57-N1/adenine58-N1)-methyltransferase
LHTFEFHQQRSEQARKEFVDHGLSEYVTVYHRDVCNEGFQMENVADAVFLDLPGPWKALVSARMALKRQGGRICSFSPCIEQVQKTVLELTQLGFTDITTIESLRRVLCVKKYSIPEFDFDHDLRDHKHTDDIYKEEEEQVGDIEIKSEPQIAAAVIVEKKGPKIKIDVKKKFYLSI